MLVALSGNLIADLAQVQLHRLLHLGFGEWACLADLHHIGPVSKMMTFDGEVDCLHDREVDVGAVDLALSVVHGHDGLGVLVWTVDVLLEVRLQGCETLANAAAVLELLSVGLSYVLLHLDGLLANDQNLLGLQLHHSIRLESDLERVLALSIWLCSVVFILVEERRTKVFGKLETEADAMRARRHTSTLYSVQLL